MLVPLKAPPSRYVLEKSGSPFVDQVACVVVIVPAVREVELAALPSKGFEVATL